MKHRVFDWMVLVVVITGGVLAWQSGRERSRLSERHARLVQMTGDLQIADETKVHVKALNTGFPLEFAWRLYFPQNYRGTLNQRSIAGPTEVPSDPSEYYIARFRVRQDESEMLRIYNHLGSRSHLIEIEDKFLAELLRGRWDKLRVEQLGAPDEAVIGADQRAVLLRVTLPEDLQRAAREKLAAEDLARYVPTLFELELNPAPSRP